MVIHRQNGKGLVVHFVHRMHCYGDFVRYFGAMKHPHALFW